MQRISWLFCILSEYFSAPIFTFESAEQTRIFSGSCSLLFIGFSRIVKKKQKSLYFNSGTQLSQKNEIEGFYIIPRKVPVP